MFENNSIKLKKKIILLIILKYPSLIEGHVEIQKGHFKIMAKREQIFNLIRLFFNLSMSI